MKPAQSRVRVATPIAMATSALTGGGLGRAEHAEIDAADRDSEQQDDLPQAQQGLEAFGQRQAGHFRHPVRRDPADDRDHEDVQGGERDTRQQRGGEQLRHAGFGDDGVEDQDDRGRNQDAERAAGGDGAGRQPLIVAELAHFRDRNPRHGGGGRERRTADRPETGAGADCAHGERAAQAAEQGIGRPVQVARHAGTGGDDAHQDEQGHDGEPVSVFADQVGGCFARRQAGIAPAVHDGIAEQAGNPEGGADRHADQDQPEDRQQAEPAVDLTRHRCLPGPEFRGWNGASARARPARISHHGHGLRGAVEPAGQESRAARCGGHRASGLTHPAGSTAPPFGSRPIRIGDARPRRRGPRP